MASDELDYNALTTYGDDEPTCGIRSMNVYSGQGFYVTQRLSDIPGARFEECESPETGEPESGIFIPFKNSGLTVTPKKNVLLVSKMEMCQVSTSHHTHLLRQIMDSFTEEHWRKLGFHFAYTGFARPIGMAKKKKGYRK